MIESVLVEFVYPDADIEQVASELWDQSQADAAIRTYKQPESPVSETFSIEVINGDDELLGRVENGQVKGDEWFCAPNIPFIEVAVQIESLTLGDRSLNLDLFVELVQTVYAATAPAYVYGLSPYGAEFIGEGFDPVPVDAADIESGRVTDVSWLMLFPERFVDTYGRAWLLDAPVTRTEELPDGAILLLADEAPEMEAAAALTALRRYFELE